MILTVIEQAPTAQPDLYTLAHGSSLGVNATTGVLSNDSDPDGDNISATLASGPSHGTLILNSDGSFQYTPSLSFTGLDNFTYHASDGLLSSDDVMVVFEVTDSAPVAVDDFYGVQAGSGLSVGAGIGVLANDSDPEGDALTASLVTGPSHGSLSLHSDGGFSYTPTLGYAGFDQFVYLVSDGALTASATVTLDVHTSNSPPWAVADSFTVFHDHTLTVPALGVLANDGDPEGDPLTASLVAGTSHGSLTLNSDGGFTYTPTSGYWGTDSFTYTASDGTSSSGTATVMLTVQNEAPVAADDTYSVAHNSTLAIAAAGVLTTDVDPEGDTLTASLVSGPSHGSLTLHDDGSFVYTPTTGYTGTDSFTYSASDGVHNSPSATVSLSVTSANAGPDAVDDSYSVAHDQELNVSDSDGVLANDTDNEGNGLTASLVSGPSHGTLTLQDDGSFVYTPAAGYSGSDSFTYSASDGTLTATATVSLSVTNEAPEAVDDLISVLGTGATTVSAEEGVLANDSDPEGDSLTASLVSGPSHGSLTLHADGSFIYTPGSGFSGQDSFTYHASDGTQLSGTATVTLSAGPVAKDDAFTVQHDAEFNIDADTGVLANDRVATGDAMSVSLVHGPSHGSLTLHADGSFDYTPHAGYLGSDSFTYQVTADGTHSNVATVSLAVVDQAPVSDDVFYSVKAGGVLQGTSDDLPSMVGDPDLDDTLHFILVSGPSHGTLSAFNDDGTFEYHPARGFVGTDSFTYRVDDGAMSSDVATVTIDVQDQAPVAIDVTHDVTQGSSLSADPSRNLLTTAAYDLDGDTLMPILVSGPAQAAAFTLNSDGTFDYTPISSFVGTDSFTFEVSDGVLTSEAATVTLNVTALTVPHDDVYGLPGSGPLIVTAGKGLLANDFNSTGAAMTVQLVQGPASGTLSLASDGSFTYTADPSQPILSEVTFEYQSVAAGVASAVVGKVTLLLPQAAVAPTFTLVSEKFTWGAYAITPDSGGRAFDTGWPKGTRDSARIPIALVAGQKFDLEVVFNVTNAALLIPADLGIKGDNPVLDPYVTPAFVIKGNQLIVTWKNVDLNPYPGVLDKVDQHWSIMPQWGESDNDWVSVKGSSHYTLYMLNNKPVGGLIRYHTVVRVGAQVAGQLAATLVAYSVQQIWGTSTMPGLPGIGVTQPLLWGFPVWDVLNDRNDPEIGFLNGLKLGVMEAFKTLKLERADDRVFQGKSRILTYYGNWGTVKDTYTTAGLLKTGDGMCGTWTCFFVDVLNAQGIDLGALPTRMIMTQAKPGLFFVKNWSPTVAGDEGPYKNSWFVRTINGIPVIPELIAMLDAQKKDYRWISKGLSKGAGVNGQGDVVPVAVFSNHIVVQMDVNDDTVFFDPSYGVMYSGATLNDRLLAFQRAALAYITVKVENPKVPRGYNVTLSLEALTAATPLRLRAFPRKKDGK